MRFSGADKLQIAANGDLIVTIGAEEIRQPQPVIYQTIRGQRKAIVGAYELADARTVKFSLGDYDQSVSLIIDPIVSYSSYFNATGDDILWAVAVGRRVISIWRRNDDHERFGDAGGISNQSRRRVIPTW